MSDLGRASTEHVGIQVNEQWTPKAYEEINNSETTIEMKTDNFQQGQQSSPSSGEKVKLE